MYPSGRAVPVLSDALMARNGRLGDDSSARRLVSKHDSSALPDRPEITLLDQLPMKIEETNAGTGYIQRD